MLFSPGFSQPFSRDDYGTALFPAVENLPSAFKLCALPVCGKTVSTLGKTILTLEKTVSTLDFSILTFVFRQFSGKTVRVGSACGLGH